jgi:hypothetical protein
MKIRLERRHGRPTVLLLAIGATMLFVGASKAAGVPLQLLGKTITASYTLSTAYRGDDGRTGNATQTTTYTIYVSTAGRLFPRGSMNRGGRV